jgi:hypothetical protein
LFSITHSARSPIAAPVISARDGRHVFGQRGSAPTSARRLHKARTSCADWQNDRPKVGMTRDDLQVRNVLLRQGWQVEGGSGRLMPLL